MESAAFINEFNVLVRKQAAVCWLVRLTVPCAVLHWKTVAFSACANRICTDAAQRPVVIGITE
eukprot:COSAG02_NODE_21079_length_803_cov_1.086648_1_plen_63_part_00